MTNEEIYENVMGHKPNKEFGIKGSFSWDDIDALMNAVKNYSIPDVGQSEQFYCTCSRAKGLDHDEEGTLYCISCQKEVQWNIEFTKMESEWDKVKWYGTNHNRNQD